MLLKSFRLIVEQLSAELFVVGENYNDAFRTLIRSLQLDNYVKLVGPLPNEKIMKLMEESDILLHTSVCEGLPMVAIEAMSKGVLVCGTEVGIMADLSNTCCVTVPVRDHKALAEKVIQLCRDSARSEELRRNAYEWVKSHDMDWYLTELVKCYQKVIQR
jgi:glycosyltransferase involved in cell wall biosynthesis